MELEKAKRIAEGVVNQLRPYCECIEIAGSIRRCRPEVKDIDLVLVPNNQGQFIFHLVELMGAPKLSGNKLIRCQMPEITFDIYIATPATWATMLLIRTGSIKHNIRLCYLAKRKGLKLHADGRGLFKLIDCGGTESRIAGDTEESIFEALDLPYAPPEQRER